MCRIYLKYMKYILHIYLTQSCIIKIYFLYKYGIYSQKYILHTSFYPAKYIFPIFSRRKVVYFAYIFFSMAACQLKINAKVKTPNRLTINQHFFTRFYWHSTILSYDNFPKRPRKQENYCLEVESKVYLARVRECCSVLACDLGRAIATMRFVSPELNYV